MKNQKGYTLIELLAVIVVMIVIGLVATGIVVSTLRGSTKTTVINQVREGGNSTLVQLSRMIGYAKSFDGISEDGETYYENCIPEPSASPISYKYIKITSFDEGETIFSCSGDPLTIASNGASLIDTGNITVESCSFTCSQSYSSENPLIGINFTLSKKTESKLAEQTFSIPFETSISIRNLRR